MEINSAHLLTMIGDREVQIFALKNDLKEMTDHRNELLEENTALYQRVKEGTALLTRTQLELQGWEAEAKRLADFALQARVTTYPEDAIVSIPTQATVHASSTQEYTPGSTPKG